MYVNRNCIKSHRVKPHARHIGSRYATCKYGVSRVVTTD